MIDSSSTDNFKDKLGNSTPELKIVHTKESEEDFIKKNIFAGGVVIKKNPDGWEVALQTIPEKREEQYWGLPKGMHDQQEDIEKKEIDKKDLLQTAINKIELEAGIYQDNLELLSYLGRIERPSRSERIWKKIHYFVFLTRQHKLEPKTKKHTADWFLLEPDELSMVPEQNEVIASTINLLKKNGF